MKFVKIGKKRYNKCELVSFFQTIFFYLNIKSPILPQQDLFVLQDSETQNTFSHRRLLCMTNKKTTESVKRFSFLKPVCRNLLDAVDILN